MSSFPTTPTLQEAFARFSGLYKEAINYPPETKAEYQKQYSITVAEVLVVSNGGVAPKGALVKDAEGRVWLLSETNNQKSVPPEEIRAGMQLEICLFEKVVTTVTMFVRDPSRED